MSEKPKQTVFYRAGIMYCERDGRVVMELPGISRSDQQLIEDRWREGSGMGAIAQAMQAMGYKV